MENYRDALMDTKRRISEQYLGSGGIHGVGLSEADKMVRLYVADADALDAAKLEEIRRVAAPFGVVVVPSAPPGVAGDR